MVSFSEPGYTGRTFCYISAFSCFMKMGLHEVSFRFLEHVSLKGAQPYVLLFWIKLRRALPAQGLWLCI